MRLMALSILNVAFEVGGRSIARFEVLRSLVTDNFCKHVFQLAKTDSTPLLSLSLRVISTVFDTLQPYLKLQQELFIFFLIERLSSPTGPGAGNRNVSVDLDDEGKITFVSSRIDNEARVGTVEVRSASPNMFLGKSTDYPRQSKNYSTSEQLAITAEVRELLLESLLQFARMPTFMVDLWYNYDCDLTCGDLFEELIQFLSKVKEILFFLPLLKELTINSLEFFPGSSKLFNHELTCTLFGYIINVYWSNGRTY